MNALSRFALVIFCFFTAQTYADVLYPDYYVDSTDTSPLYIGFFVANATFDVDNPSDSISVDTSERAYKLFTGLKFNEYFSMEAGVISMDSITLNGTTQQNNYIFQGDNSNGIFGNVLVGYPVTESFSIFGKMGVYGWLGQNRYGKEDYNNYNDEEETWLGKFLDETTSSSFTYGIGASYTWEHLVFRADWERFEKDTINVNLVSVGIAYHF